MSSLRLPPGPKSTALTTAQFIREPMRALAGFRRAYGDIFTLPLFGSPLVVTCHPELTRDVFTAPPESFGVVKTKGLSPLFGTSSVLIAEGDSHQKMRRLLLPPFQGQRLRAFLPTMDEIVKSELESSAERGVFSAQELAQNTSLNVIVRVVFGVQGARDVAAFCHATRETMERIDPSFLYLPFLQRRFAGHGPFARYVRASEAFDELLYRHLGAVRSGRVDASGVLGLLLQARDEQGQGFSDKELRDQLRTLLIGGFETTAIALSWALYLIDRNPEVKARLRSELHGLDMNALLEQPYLDAVITETLRIRPPVLDAARRLKRSIKVGSYQLPVGVAVAPSIYLTHYREDLFPNPERFDPERFLSRKHSPFELFPFGGGHRRCLGAALSMQELKLALGSLLAHYEFRVTNSEPVLPRRRNVTIAPDRPVMVRLSARAA